MCFTFSYINTEQEGHYKSSIYKSSISYKSYLHLTVSDEISLAGFGYLPETNIKHKYNLFCKH